MVSTWSGTRGASDWNHCKKPRCSRTPSQSLYTWGKQIHWSENTQCTCGQPKATPESWTTQLIPSIPVLQGHLGFPRITPWLVLGRVLERVWIPGVAAKGRKARRSVHFSFNSPNLSTSAWRNWVWAQAFSWKYYNWNLWLFWKLLKAIPGRSHWDTLSFWIPYPWPATGDHLDVFEKPWPWHSTQSVSGLFSLQSQLSITKIRTITMYKIF